MKKIKLKKHQKININFPLNYNNVEELFISKLKLKKNKNFLFFPEENLKLTYLEFSKEYNKLKNILVSKKIKKGDKVSIIFSNGSQFIKLYFAILSLGAVAVPINPDLSSDEMIFIIKDSNSKLVVYSKEVLHKVKKFKKIHIIEFSKLKLNNSKNYFHI